jgi:hypothetical protein
VRKNGIKLTHKVTVLKPQEDDELF